MNGFASPYYGKLQTASLPSEVKRIWYSRDEELPELPRHRWSWELQTDPELSELRDLARRIVETTPLTEREEIAIMTCVIEDGRLEDLGEELDVTKERARQILQKGLRRLRTHQKKVTGINPGDLYIDILHWQYYKRMQQHARQRGNA